MIACDGAFQAELHTRLKEEVTGDLGEQQKTYLEQETLGLLWRKLANQNEGITLKAILLVQMVSRVHNNLLQKGCPARIINSY